MAVNNYFTDTQPPLPFHHLDDAAFNAVLFEYEHGPLSFDFDRLESVIFNPIEHLPSVMENYFINNLDPDINFSKLMPPNSSYMVENEINNLLRDFFLTALLGTKYITLITYKYNMQFLNGKIANGP
jgi:hypothetical protein